MLKPKLRQEAVNRKRQLLSEAADGRPVHSNHIRTVGWMLIYTRLVPALDVLVSGGDVPATEEAAALQ